MNRDATVIVLTIVGFVFGAISVLLGVTARPSAADYRAALRH